MTTSEEKQKRDPRRVLKKSRIYRRRIIAWCCFGTAALLIAAALLYVFIWSQPGQPQAPEAMAEATLPPSPAQTDTPTDAPTATPTPVKTTAPEPTKKPMVIQESFEALYEQNQDIVGWIRLNGTPIDYPILQAEDNEYYMSRDFEGNEHEAGSLFLDFRCDFTNMYEAAHQIVYGHNMKNGSMFQALTRYEDAEFFENNRFISVNTLYGNYMFEVFAVYETPISYYYLEMEFTNRSAWKDFAEVFQEKSMHQTDVELTGDEVVLTLSTCTNQHRNSERFVVQARLINPEEYDTVYRVMY